MLHQAAAVRRVQQPVAQLALRRGRGSEDGSVGSRPTTRARMRMAGAAARHSGGQHKVLGRRAAGGGGATADRRPPAPRVVDRSRPPVSAAAPLLLGSWRKSPPTLRLPSCCCCLLSPWRSPARIRPAQCHQEGSPRRGKRRLRADFWTAPPVLVSGTAGRLRGRVGVREWSRRTGDHALAWAARRRCCCRCATASGATSGTQIQAVTLWQNLD